MEADLAVSCQLLTSPSGLPNRLQAQSPRKLDLRRGCHEITEKSSKIIPLGAPLSQ